MLDLLPPLSWGDLQEGTLKFCAFIIAVSIEKKVIAFERMVKGRH